MRAHLIKRYRYLLSGETVSTVLFVFLYISLVSRDGWQWSKWRLVGYALLCVLLILFQGIVLWSHKYSQLQKGSLLLSAGMRHWLPRWRTLNWIVIGCYPLIAVTWAVFLSRAHIADAIAGTGIWLFAIAEQINYYYYQLCYDNKPDIEYLLTHRRLKEGFVARELHH